jgi:hypothetical protein
LRLPAYSELLTMSKLVVVALLGMLALAAAAEVAPQKKV